MVETPTAAVASSSFKDTEDSDAPEKEGLLETGLPSITLVSARPVTSKIRTALRHLSSQAGRYAKWRGLVPFTMNALALSTVNGVLNAVLPHFVPFRHIIAGMLASIATCRLHATWVHAVISMPSTKRWYKRVPPVSAWKQLWFPAAAKAFVLHMAIFVARDLGAFMLQGQHNKLQNATGADIVLAIACVIGYFILIISMSVFVILPAAVTLVRIEASLLPEEEDTIVPFDRTFSGKIIPSVLGGSGTLGFLDAWRSFNWEARRRLLKLYAKYFVISVATVVVLAHVLALETWAIMGPALGKMLADAKHNIDL